MSDLSDTALSRILVMDREQRYAYSVQTIAASGQMWWLLSGSRYAIQKTPDGGRHIHFWPHRTLAENAAQGPWLDHTPAVAERLAQAAKAGDFTLECPVHPSP